MHFQSKNDVFKLIWRTVNEALKILENFVPSWNIHFRVKSVVRLFNQKLCCMYDYVIGFCVANRNQWFLSIWPTNAKAEHISISKRFYMCDQRSIFARMGRQSSRNIS